MWAAIGVFLKALFAALLPFITKPADQGDTNAPKDLKDDLNSVLDDLPPTPRM
jgi:hypothetical protein